MRKIITSIKTVGFFYDFAVDGGGPAVFNTGIFLPENACYINCNVLFSTVFTAGLGCRLDIGTATLPSEVTSITFPVSSPAQAFVFPGFANPGPLLFEIAVAGVTAGSFRCMISYWETN